MLDNRYPRVIYINRWLVFLEQNVYMIKPDTKIVVDEMIQVRVFVTPPRTKVRGFLFREEFTQNGNKQRLLCNLSLHVTCGSKFS